MKPAAAAATTLSATVVVVGVITEMITRAQTSVTDR